MSEFFAHHVELIQRRWPALAARLLVEDTSPLQADLVEGLGSTLSVNGIQLTSRHDRVAEAQLQAASLAPDSPVLHVYGTGLGDLQAELLAREPLQRLYVHILNGAVFALVLQLLEQPWLEDPRVELLYAGDLGEIQLPFFALPAELVLADINPQALAYARANAELNGMANAQCRQGDLYGAADGQFDFIVANPPYLVDPAGRTYRDGGSFHTRRESVRQDSAS